MLLKPSFFSGTCLSRIWNICPYCSLSYLVQELPAILLYMKWLQISVSAFKAGSFCTVKSYLSFPQKIVAFLLGQISRKLSKAGDTKIKAKIFYRGDLLLCLPSVRISLSTLRNSPLAMHQLQKGSFSK